MEAILKTFLLANDSKKWSLYETTFKYFFNSLNKNFDEVLEYIRWYYNKTETLPDWIVVHAQLVSEKNTPVIEYTTKIVQDINIEVFEDLTQFAAWLSISQTKIIHDEMVSEIKKLNNATTTASKQSKEELFVAAANFKSAIGKLQEKADSETGSTYGTIWGAENQELQLLYEKRKKENADGYISYFPMGINGMESIKPKLGDLAIIGGFVSHGKSIWLRQLAYHYAVNLGQNVIFFTFEMNYATVRQLFSILHANNENKFPYNPPIQYDAFMNASLTDEQENSLLFAAEHDFLTNMSYGTIHIEQPNKSRYCLSDLAARIQEIENNDMPLSIVIVDYLTLLYPLDSNSKQQPSVGDYNQLFKEFKNILLTHRNAEGIQKGLLGITAAQISRHGFEAAVKRDGIYDISAFSHYSEIERSADILLTSYAPDSYKSNSRIRLQALKNRNGSVPMNPVDLDCSYTCAFSMGKISPDDENYDPDALDTLNL